MTPLPEFDDHKSALVMADFGTLVAADCKETLLTYRGETRTVAQWAEHLNIAQTTLGRRIFRRRYAMENNIHDYGVQDLFKRSDW